MKNRTFSAGSAGGGKGLVWKGSLLVELFALARKIEPSVARKDAATVVSRQSD